MIQKKTTEHVELNKKTRTKKKTTEETRSLLPRQACKRGEVQ